MENERSDAAPNLFAQLPAEPRVTHSYTRSSSLSPCYESVLQQTKRAKQRTESGPTLLRAQGNRCVGIKRLLVAHHIRRQSPVLQPFLWGGPDPRRTRWRQARDAGCYSNTPPSRRGRGACQRGDACVHKTSCGGRVEITGGENRPSLQWKWKVREGKGCKRASQQAEC